MSNASVQQIHVNTLRPRQNGRLFADDTFKRIFLNENIKISIKISLKFVPRGLINTIPSSVQIMAYRRPGDKPLSEPMMVNFLTHICVTRPQWDNWFKSLNEIAFQPWAVMVVPISHFGSPIGVFSRLLMSSTTSAWLYQVALFPWRKPICNPQILTSTRIWH